MDAVAASLVGPKRSLLALPKGFNWFLILIAAVVAVLVLGACVYLLVEYQHPEDRNQAWFPKIMVVFSMSLAIWTVLMFPLDVANTQACAANISPSACTYTLPMEQLWFAVFIANLVLVFVIMPFTLFFYEADSDYTFCQKVKGSLLWTAGFLVFILLIIVIMYLLIGYVVYPTQQLTSGVVSMSSLQNLSTFNTTCIVPARRVNSTEANVEDQCSAFGTTFKGSTWKLRVSLPVYIMAIQSVVGWLLFLVFAGVGLLCTPIDWLQEMLGRPRAVITKSEYMRRAQVIAQRAKQIMNMLQMLRRGDRDRRWRSNFQKLQREVALMEDDEYQLERVFPQGEDGEVKWVLFMLGFYVLGFMAFAGLCLSLAWVVHIIAYMLPPRRPLHPMLNDMFIALDGVFPLFGVAAFAVFCLYLMTVAMKGNFMLGLNFLIIKLYPMRPGATMMSSFIVNTALVLVMSPAIVQFCAQAFAVYANGTAIFDVFGNQVMYLIGIRYIYNFNIFLYAMLAIVGLSAVFLGFRGKKVWKKRDPMEAYSMID